MHQATLCSSKVQGLHTFGHLRDDCAYPTAHNLPEHLTQAACSREQQMAYLHEHPENSTHDFIGGPTTHPALPAGLYQTINRSYTMHIDPSATGSTDHSNNATTQRMIEHVTRTRSREDNSCKELVPRTGLLHASSVTAHKRHLHVATVLASLRLHVGVKEHTYSQQVAVPLLAHLILDVRGCL